MGEPSTGSMDRDFSEHLEQVRARRGELGESMHALEDALALPLGLAVWGRRVRAALTELASDLRDHVDLTESPGGLYAGLTETAPRLSHGIEAQLEDHRFFIDEVERLLQERDDGITRDELGSHRDKLTSLLHRLVKHRQRGSDLIYEAYEVDIGGQG
jgi:hypothetical protein